jgi:hypothetical protein
MVLKVMSVLIIALWLFPMHDVMASTSQADPVQTYDNDELLAFALSHLISAIRGLETSNSTHVDIHLTTAQEQVLSILDRESRGTER